MTALNAQTLAPESRDDTLFQNGAFSFHRTMVKGEASVAQGGTQSAARAPDFKVGQSVAADVLPAPPAQARRAVDASIRCFKGDQAILRIEGLAIAEICVPIDYIPSESQRIGAPVSISAIRQGGFSRPLVRSRQVEVVLTDAEESLLKWIESDVSSEDT